MVEWVCRKREIRIGNTTMEVRLCIFEPDDLDVILGMDFLTKYHAILNCFNK